MTNREGIIYAEPTVKKAVSQGDFPFENILRSHCIDKVSERIQARLYSSIYLKHQAQVAEVFRD